MKRIILKKFVFSLNKTNMNLKFHQIAHFYSLLHRDLQQKLTNQHKTEAKLSQEDSVCAASKYTPPYELLVSNILHVLK